MESCPEEKRRRGWPRRGRLEPTTGTPAKGDMATGLNRAVAGRLSPRTRRRVRQVADRLSAPVGSVKGARTTEPVVALSYDDGPDPEGTPAVLAALADGGVRATSSSWSSGPSGTRTWSGPCWPAATKSACTALTTAG
jgi:hypothetical protein